jgi:hypothetical protein
MEPTPISGGAKVTAYPFRQWPLKPDPDLKREQEEINNPEKAKSDCGEAEVNNDNKRMG